MVKAKHIVNLWSLEKEDKNDFIIRISTPKTKDLLYTYHSFRARDIQADGKHFYQHIETVRESEKESDLIKLKIINQEELNLSYHL